MSPDNTAPIPIVRVYTRLEVGGIERQLLRVLPRLRQRGRYAPTLLLTEREGALADELRQQGVPVELVPLSGRLAPWSVTPLTRRLRQLDARLVHAHTYDANVPATVAAFCAGRIPTIASIHNVHATSARRALQERFLNRWRAAIVSVSSGVREHYLRTVGAPPDRAVVLYNGLDVGAVQEIAIDRPGVRARFGLTEATLLVVCVARLVPQKQHTVLLSAWQQVAPRFPAAQLLLLGGGPLESTLRADAVARGLEHRVRFAGNRDDVPAILRGCDISVLASDREGFSNVLLESLAAGVPIVATDVGGNLEAMLGERTGRLVPHGDADALARALGELLADEPRRHALARECARRAWRFDIAKTVSDTEALYDAILAGRPLPHGVD